MACASCMLDGHGDTLAAIISSKAAPCCGPTMGDATGDPCGKTFLPPITFLWPSDVRDKIGEIDPQWTATNGAVDACPALPPTQRAGWKSDFAAWQAFRDEGVGTFGAANKMEATLRFQCKLREWQDLISATSCVLAGPKVPTPTPTTSLDEAMGTIKIVAIGGAVIAGVVLVAPVVWEYVGSKRLASRRK
jgi:hypothetical protein